MKSFDFAYRLSFLDNYASRDLRYCNCDNDASVSSRVHAQKGLIWSISYSLPQPVVLLFSRLLDLLVEGDFRSPIPEFSNGQSLFALAQNSETGPQAIADHVSEGGRLRKMEIISVVLPNISARRCHCSSMNAKGTETTSNPNNSWAHGRPITFRNV